MKASKDRPQWDLLHWVCIHRKLVPPSSLDSWNKKNTEGGGPSPFGEPQGRGSEEPPSLAPRPQFRPDPKGEKR